MQRWDKVAIVGVGLIGGSIGLDLLGRRLARHVVGIGRRAASLKAAREMGAVSSTTTNLARGVRDCELAIICTPVGRVADDLLAAAAAMPSDSLVTDAASTKAKIVATVEAQLPAGIGFVGSHPLAGGEKSGPQAAVRDLFVDRVVVVTPTAQTAAKSLQDAEQFWKALGARVRSMTPADHDRALAVTSHLPHVIASCLAAGTSPELLDLVAGGWLDSTRIAASDPDLWQQILATNRSDVLQAIDSFQDRLAVLRRALQSQDAAGVRQWLELGQSIRKSLASPRANATPPPRNTKHE